MNYRRDYGLNHLRQPNEWNHRDSFLFGLVCGLCLAGALFAIIEATGLITVIR